MSNVFGALVTIAAFDQTLKMTRQLPKDKRRPDYERQKSKSFRRL